MRRRDFLAGAVSASALWRCGKGGGRLPGGLESTQASNDVARLLSRISYGARPGELDRVLATGAEAHLEEQLHPESIPDLKSRFLVRRVELAGLTSPDLFLFPAKEVLGALRQATLVSALTSERQLLEVMVELWSDHFNVYGDKGDGAWLKVADDREIRRHALGRFRDLLRASLTSPAMLVYLDGERNGRGKPNENHARELLELHTLGVSGGYTQDDVRELARLLTGWRLRSGAFRRGLARVDAEAHDGGPKTVLGQRFAGSAETDLDALADLLASHPSTALFLAKKLCRRFIGDVASSELVASVAGVFRRSGGDVRQTLGALLRSPELLTSPPLFKRPYTFVLSCLRAYDGRSDGGSGLQAELERLSQIPFGWPTPDGYPDDEAAWRSTLVPRFRFAQALAHGRIDGTRIDSRGLPSDRIALDLCRPEHQYR